jgi:Xaa-Pro dipeptidase
MGEGNGTTHSAQMEALFASHLAVITDRFTEALERTGYDRVVIAAGELIYKFADDNSYPFHCNPQFLLWAPLLDAAGSFVQFTPGQPPRLIHFQPKDYWHVVPQPANGAWAGQFEVRVIHEVDEVPGLLDLSPTTAFLGDWSDRYSVWGIDNVNPVDLVRILAYQRAAKTDYELECMREASRLGVIAHRAAEQAYRAGASEYEIHHAYLESVGLGEAGLPYGNIIALEAHGAVLHYTDLLQERIDAPRSFLIDAGVRSFGYASDITRTYAWEDDDFAGLIRSVDRLEQELCEMVRPGTDYRDIHQRAHELVADALVEHGIVTVSAEAAVVGGITSTFFPHGIGHLIGLQVHDVAGNASDDQGGTVPRPQQHPYLRLTRVLEEDFVVTIEPGIYFIPMLLETLRASDKAGAVDWRRVADFLPYGGVRIEDDVRATTDRPENLTRDAYASS